VLKIEDLIQTRPEKIGLPGSTHLLRPHLSPPAKRRKHGITLRRYCKISAGNLRKTGNRSLEGREYSLNQSWGYGSFMDDQIGKLVLSALKETAGPFGPAASLHPHWRRRRLELLVDVHKHLIAHHRQRAWLPKGAPHFE
jgi:hypothetical protein